MSPAVEHFLDVKSVQTSQSVYLLPAANGLNWLSLATAPAGHLSTQDSNLALELLVSARSVHFASSAAAYVSAAHLTHSSLSVI